MEIKFKPMVFSILTLNQVISYNAYVKYTRLLMVRRLLSINHHEIFNQYTFALLFILVVYNLFGTAVTALELP